MGRFVSPDDMLAAAREQMLDGREIATETDAVMVMNFIALNVQADCAEPICQIFTRMYPEQLGCLDEETVRAIVAFQQERAS